MLPLLLAFPIFCESYFIRDEFTGEILTDVNYTAKEVGDQPYMLTRKGAKLQPISDKSSP